MQPDSSPLTLCSNHFKQHASFKSFITSLISVPLPQYLFLPPSLKFISKASPHRWKCSGDLSFHKEVIVSSFSLSQSLTFTSLLSLYYALLFHSLIYSFNQSFHSGSNLWGAVNYSGDTRRAIYAQLSFLPYLSSQKALLRFYFFLPFPLLQSSSFFSQTRWLSNVY